MKRKDVYDFIITLKNPDYKVYNLITALLCVMTVSATILALVNWPFQYLAWVNIALIGVIIVNFVIVFFNKNKNRIVSFKWALYAAAFLWLLYPMHVIYLSIVFVLAAFLEAQVKKPQEIGFSDDGITFNTFPFKNYLWSEVRNILLKDDLLTIDFKSDKLIQREIEPAELTEEENEFNEFCRQQINRP